MTKYVAFLRGINVGGRVIKMAELKEVFEKRGYRNVKTVLQTGNVVFESPVSNAQQLKTDIEALLTDAFHYTVKVQVIPQEQVAAIVARCPFGEPIKDVHFYVIFFENGLEKELVAEAAAHVQENEAVQAGDGVVYWKVPRGLTLKSQFAKFLTKTKYKDFNTNRNLNTLQKIITS
jgi:uncharacterized protein (DUF1697 family)